MNEANWGSNFLMSVIKDYFCNRIPNCNTSCPITSLANKKSWSWDQVLLSHTGTLSSPPPWSWGWVALLCGRLNAPTWPYLGTCRPPKTTKKALTWSTTISASSFSSFSLPLFGETWCLPSSLDRTQLLVGSRKVVTFWLNWTRTGLIASLIVHWKLYNVNFLGLQCAVLFVYTSKFNSSVVSLKTACNTLHIFLIYHWNVVRVQWGFKYLKVLFMKYFLSFDGQAYRHCSIYKACSIKPPLQITNDMFLLKNKHSFAIFVLRAEP